MNLTNVFPYIIIVLIILITLFVKSSIYTLLCILIGTILIYQFYKVKLNDKNKVLKFIIFTLIIEIVMFLLIYMIGNYIPNIFKEEFEFIRAKIIPYSTGYKAPVVQLSVME